MTDAERDRRWSMAKGHYQAGGLCFDKGLFGASTTRSYYAAYQGMWVAVGDPPLGRWRHHGLIQQFCWGQWTELPSLLTTLASYRQRLRTLYDYRTDADYTARTISQTEANDGLILAQEILAFVARAKGFPFP
jgi:uncharacterized protein (UPF0332 family)